VQPTGNPASGITLGILNLEQIDGKPLTVGETLPLQATAQDRDGSDLSGSIQWIDHQGKVFGTGSAVTYKATAVVMETISARVKAPDGRQNSVRTSFTVSQPGYVLAPHLKSLPDAAKNNILKKNLPQGILHLKEDANLPTILVGDVLVGAEFRVPPVQVKSLKRDQGALLLDVTRVGLGEVIYEGVLDQWEAVELNRSGVVRRLSASAGSARQAATSCQGFLNGPTEPLTWKTSPLTLVNAQFTDLALDIPDRIKWDRFVYDAGLRLSGRFSMSLTGEVGFCPVFKWPKIVPQRNASRPIKLFETEIGFEDAYAKAALQMDGLVDLRAKQVIGPIKVPLFRLERFFVGFVPGVSFPIPVWVGIDGLELTYTIQPSIQMNAIALADLTYRAGSGTVTLIYDDSNGQQAWSAEPQVDIDGTLEPSLRVRGNTEGRLVITDQADMGLGLWVDYFPGEIGGVDDPIEVGLLSPRVGRRITWEARVDLPFTPDVVVEQPQRATYAGPQPLNLRASVTSEDQPQISFFGGLDLVVGAKANQLPSSCPFPSTNLISENRSESGSVSFATGTGLGGSYSSVRYSVDTSGNETLKAGEVHHIPAFDSYDGAIPLSYGRGPAIWMSKDDHSRTASHPNMPGSAGYRDKQRNLIKQCKFREAQELDFQDIRLRSGDRYDIFINEMNIYTDSLLNSRPDDFTPFP
jgi:hypothetical protein